MDPFFPLSSTVRQVLPDGRLLVDIEIANGGVKRAIVAEEDVFETVSPGSRRMVYFVENLEVGDGVDARVSLRAGNKKTDTDCEKVIQRMITRRGGFLDLGEDASPSEIRERLGMSRRQFRKALGRLVRRKTVVLLPGGVASVPSSLRAAANLSIASTRESRSVPRRLSNLRAERKRNALQYAGEAYGLLESGEDETMEHELEALQSLEDTSSSVRIASSRTSRLAAQTPAGEGIIALEEDETHEAHEIKEPINLVETMKSKELEGGTTEDDKELEYFLQARLEQDESAIHQVGYDEINDDPTYDRMADLATHLKRLPGRQRAKIRKTITSSKPTSSSSHTPLPIPERNE